MPNLLVSTINPILSPVFNRYLNLILVLPRYGHGSALFIHFYPRNLASVTFPSPKTTASISSSPKP